MDDMSGTFDHNAVEVRKKAVREAIGVWPKECDLGKRVDVVFQHGDLLWADYMNYKTGILTRVFND